jgi:hypothetical protein
MTTPPSIPLCLEKRISSLDGSIFVENVDINLLTALIHSNHLKDKFDTSNYTQKLASQLYTNEKHQLISYLNNYDKKLNAIKVQYKKPRHKYGRVFPVKSLGLTCLSKKIRNTLIKGKYIDFDIKNAQPEIIYNICKSNNLIDNFPHIEGYVLRREDILQEVTYRYQVTRNDAKKLFIRLAFFGTFYGWLEELGLDTKIQPTLFINGFKEELNKIANIIRQHNPILYETCRKQKEAKGKTNIIGSMFSLYLQDYEENIMDVATNWISNNTKIMDYQNSIYKENIYEFDGFKLNEEKVYYYGGHQLIITNLENVILKETGFKLQFEVKPIEKFFQIEYTPYIAPLSKNELKELQLKEKELLKENKQKEKELKNEIKNRKNEIEYEKDLERLKKQEQEDLNELINSINKNEFFDNLIEGQKNEYFDLIEFIINCPNDYTIANVIYEIFGNNYKYVDVINNIWYKFYNNKWTIADGGIHFREIISNEFTIICKNKLVTICESICNNNDIDVDVESSSKKKKRILSDIIFKLGRTSDKNNILKELTNKCFDETFLNKINQNKNLIGFDNGVYDLVKMQFRQMNPDDYITMSCGYDYEPCNSGSLFGMEQLLKQIIPDKDVRKLYLQVLSAGFTGLCIEKFIVLNGGGRNGKGLINEFVKLIFGDYCYIYAPVCILTEKYKTGGNPEIANLDKKRIIIMKEPEGDNKINNDAVKTLTGGGNISGRQLYSNKCEVSLHGILIMECNKRPLFKEDPEDADRERLIDILFPNRFTTNNEEIDNINVFKADSKYKTDEWKNKHRNAFLHILLNSFKQFKKNNFNFDIPKCVRDRTEEYLNKSFPILELFYKDYQHVDNNKSFIKLKEVTQNIINSEVYLNFDKKDKRKYNQQYIQEFLTKKLGKYWKDRFKIDSIDYRNVLTNFRKINNDEEEECEGL